MHGPTRRQVLGAAWTTPVIVATVGAPQAAASPPCPTIPNTTSAYTLTVSGNGGAGRTGFNTNGQYFSDRDNISASDPLILTLTTNIPVTAGTTYSFNSFTFNFNYGNNSANQSSTLTTTVTFGGVQVFAYTSRTAPNNVPYTNYTVPATGSYTAPAGTTSAALVITTTVAKVGAGQTAGDDIRLSAPTLLTCHT